jgi:starvation-inducible DNA-binding protein
MDRELLAAALQLTLADTFNLYVETHAYHWNVVGANFVALHALFEEQYNELWISLDLIAERIRALEQPVFFNFSSLEQYAAFVPDTAMYRSDKMLFILLMHNQMLLETLMFLQDVAARENDEATLTLAADRIFAIEKSMWKLKALQEPLM